jgi:hypothetical protein
MEENDDNDSGYDSCGYEDNISDTNCVWKELEEN